MDIRCLPRRGGFHKLLLISAKEPWLAREKRKLANLINKGQMYSQVDRKWVYVACVTLFEIGSAVCGAANSMTALIVGRAICGLGGAGMYTGVMTILSILSTEKERPIYLGLTGLTWGLGIVLGPIIGGAFASSNATWRWSFYINLVIGALCAPIYLFLLPSMDPQATTTRMKERLRNVDLAGAIILTGTFLSGLMAINFGGAVYAWSSARTIALFCVAGILFVIFWAQQISCIGTGPETPTFPVQFLKNKELALLFFAEACATVLNFVPIYFVPLYFQFAKHDDALEAGVRLLPLVVFLVITIVGNGGIVSHYPRYMPWFLIGPVFGLVGAALLYTVDINTSVAKIYGYTILMGFGSGCFVTLPFSVAQAQVDPRYIPVAVSFLSFSQLAASAVTLSIANTVFLNEATSRITRITPSLTRTEIRGIISGVGAATLAGLGQKAQAQITGVIVASLNKAYIICMTSAALAIVLSLFLDKGIMRREGN